MKPGSWIKVSFQIIIGILAPTIAFITSSVVSPCFRGMVDYFVKPISPLPVYCRLINLVDSIMLLILIVLLFIGLVLLLLNILQGLLRLTIVTEVKVKAFLTVAITFSVIIIFIRLISIILELFS